VAYSRIVVLSLRKAAGLALLVGVFLAAAGAAFAQSADDPLADEYAEDIPTATGPHHSSGNGGSASNGGSSYVAPLSPVVRTNLYKQTGPDARLLEKVATSPRYGAPSPRRPEGSGSSPSRDGGGAASAALSALGGGQGGVPGILLAVLVATGILAGASVIFRRRETGPSATSP
jgi:ABC-type phosphate transport system substrate-binding protein